MRPLNEIRKELQAELERFDETRERIEALTDELHEAGRFSESSLETIKSALGVNAGSVSSVAASSTGVEIGSASGPKPERKHATKAEVEPIVRDMLAASNRPVPTREILARLEKRGLTFGGKSPAGNLSARLSQIGLFENVKGEGWVLKDQSSRPSSASSSDDRNLDIDDVPRAFSPKDLNGSGRHHQHGEPFS